MASNRPIPTVTRIRIRARKATNHGKIDARAPRKLAGGRSVRVGLRYSDGMRSALGGAFLVIYGFLKSSLDWWGEVMHTKGPWAVDLGYKLYDGSIHPMTIFTDDGKGNGVEIPNRDDYDREWRNTEACANAHLISSAPDLLEALESCVAMLDRLVPEGAYCPGINGVLELARSAIAKAKGTTNE